MNVAIFSDCYYPEINGVSNSIALFRHALQRLGHTIYLFVPEYNRPYPDDPQTIRIPSIAYFFPAMRERRFVLPAPSLLRKFAKLNIDIIHSQVAGNSSAYALFASWLFAVPHVHTYHTYYMAYRHYMPFPESLSRRGVLWITTRLCGRCQCVIAPGKDIGNVLRSYGVSAPIMTIPTGIEPPVAEPAMNSRRLRQRYRLPEKKSLLLYVGRIGIEKNLQLLIEVLQQLTRKQRAVDLCIVGDGPARSALEHRAQQLGVRHRLHLVGYVAPKMVFNFYRAAELFLFPSQTETQGLVLLEALSTGLPVVAVRGMGINDLQIHENGGLLCEPTVASFTATVETMLDNRPFRQRMAERAIEKATNYTIDHKAQQLLDCYRMSIADYRRHGLPRHRRRNWEWSGMSE